MRDKLAALPQLRDRLFAVVVELGDRMGDAQVAAVDADRVVGAVTDIYAPVDDATPLTSGTNVVVKGCFLVLGTGALSTIDNTAGTLYSAGTFTGGDKTVSNGDTLQGIPGDLLAAMIRVPGLREYAGQPAPRAEARRRVVPDQSRLVAAGRKARLHLARQRRARHGARS